MADIYIFSDNDEEEPKPDSCYRNFCISESLEQNQSDGMGVNLVAPNGMGLCGNSNIQLSNTISVNDILSIFEAELPLNKINRAYSNPLQKFLACYEIHLGNEKDISFTSDDKVHARLLMGRILYDTLLYTVEHELEAIPSLAEKVSALFKYKDDGNLTTEIMEQVPQVVDLCQMYPHSLGVHVKPAILPSVVYHLFNSTFEGRNTTQAALLVLLEQNLLDEEDLFTDLIPAIMHYAKSDQSDGGQLIVEAATVITKMCPLMGSHFTHTYLLERFIMLCCDYNHNVRRVCVNNFVEVCSVLEQEEVDRTMLPIFIKLCNDSNWSIRKRCMEVLVPLAKITSPYARREVITPNFLLLLDDKSSWVSLAAFNSLGPFISTFAELNQTPLYKADDGTLTLRPTTRHTELYTEDENSKKSAYVTKKRKVFVKADNPTFNEVNFWKMPLPDIELPLDLESADEIVDCVPDVTDQQPSQDIEEVDSNSPNSEEIPCLYYDDEELGWTMDPETMNELMRTITDVSFWSASEKSPESTGANCDREQLENQPAEISQTNSTYLHSHSNPIDTDTYFSHQNEDCNDSIVDVTKDYDSSEQNCHPDHIFAAEVETDDTSFLATEQQMPIPILSKTDNNTVSDSSPENNEEQSHCSSCCPQHTDSNEVGIGACGFINGDCSNHSSEGNSDLQNKYTSDPAGSADISTKTSEADCKPDAHLFAQRFVLQHKTTDQSSAGASITYSNSMSANDEMVKMLAGIIHARPNSTAGKSDVSEISCGGQGSIPDAVPSMETKEDAKQQDHEKEEAEVVANEIVQNHSEKEDDDVVIKTWGGMYTSDDDVGLQSTLCEDSDIAPKVESGWQMLPDLLLSSRRLGENRYCDDKAEYEKERSAYEDLVSGANTQTIVPQELLKSYVMMVYPPVEQKDEKAQTKVDCAYSLPGVALTVGRQHPDIIMHTYRKLALDDSWKVRRTLAASIHEMAFILGEETADNVLLDIYCSYITDVEAVQHCALRSLSSFMRVLSPDKGRQLLPRLTNFVSFSNVVNWRLNLTLAEQLGEVADIVTERECFEYLCPIVVELMNSKAVVVRRNCYPLISKLVKILYTDNDKYYVKNFMRPFIASSREKSWSKRQDFVFIARQMLTDECIPLSFWCNQLFHQLMDLANDKVPNVRMAVAKTIVMALKPLDFFKVSVNEYGMQVEDALEQLLTDLDRDVRQSCHA